MKKLWIAFTAVIAISFGVLGWIGTRIYQEMPPLPDRVVTTDGQVVIDSGEISAGQNVWQAMGGMEVGSVWGHGSYVAPDWTADSLHRELTFVLDDWARAEAGKSYGSLGVEQQAAAGFADDGANDFRQQHSADRARGAGIVFGDDFFSAEMLGQNADIPNQPPNQLFLGG